MNIKCESAVDRFLGFDPATLYEAAGHRGMVDPTIRPAWAGAQLCGVATTVECPPADNLMLHHAVAAAVPGVVIVANLGGYLLTGAWGEILTVAAQARGVIGLAVDGAVRDIEAIAEHAFPVFSRGLAIGACTKERPGRLDVPIQFGGVTVRPGDIVVGNADGIVIIEQDRADQVYEAALARREREAELMEQLRLGKTTLELLGLPGLERLKAGK
ncbi:MAG: RraA family protein [Acidobacteriia bacterium]|nr:RraA family protein [Terriglobia bacterium]